MCISLFTCISSFISRCYRFSILFVKENLRTSCLDLCLISLNVLSLVMQGNVCANETLCTNEKNIKLIVSIISKYVAIVFNLK